MNLLSDSEMRFFFVAWRFLATRAAVLGCAYLLWSVFVGDVRDTWSIKYIILGVCGIALLVLAIVVLLLQIRRGRAGKGVITTQLFLFLFVGLLGIAQLAAPGPAQFRALVAFPVALFISLVWMSGFWVGRHDVIWWLEQRDPVLKQEGDRRGA
jgi:hypothetical protein